MRKILILLSVILLLSCNGSHNEKKDYSNFDSMLAQKKENEKKAEEAQEEERRKSLFGYWKSDDGEVELAIYEDKIILIVDEILECKAASWEFNDRGWIEFDGYCFYICYDYEEDRNKVNYITAGDYKLKKHSVDKISYYSSRAEKYGSYYSSAEKYGSSSYSRGDNYSWIDGKWNATSTFSGQDMYGFYHGAIYIELHINYNNRTVKVYMAENDGSPMTVARGIQYSLIYNGSFSIDTYNNVLNCGRGGNYKLDAESRRIYNNGSDGRINFYRGSKM